jgi:hypothetical protein
MNEINAGGVNDITRFASIAGMNEETTSICINLPNDSMTQTGIQVRMEQKDGTPDLKDLMRQMITALQQNSEESAHVDLGGKDTRPSDLSAAFSPKMDQDHHLYSGKGDDMVMVV